MSEQATPFLAELDGIPITNPLTDDGKKVLARLGFNLPEGAVITGIEQEHHPTEPETFGAKAHG